MSIVERHATANLAAALVRHAQARPEAVAVLDGEAIYRYRELAHLSARVRAVLEEHGVTPGARVAWMLDNGIAAASVCIGTLAAGAISVPLSPLLREREVGHCLADSGAALCFAPAERCAELTSLADRVGVTFVAIETIGWASPSSCTPLALEPVAHDDAAYIIYTSGTTGNPKGVVLSHATLRSNVAVAAKLSDAGEGDVLYGGLPLTHIFGQSCALHAALAVGASVMLEQRFHAEALLAALRRGAIHVFTGVPTMFTALLHAMDEAGIVRLDSGLKTIVSGGAALPLEVLHAIEFRLGATILESYGLSEAAGYVLSERRDRIEAQRRQGARVAGSVGEPVDGCEVRIVDDEGRVVPPGTRGELEVRGRNVMLGYWNDPDATAAAFRDGWLRTGDLATCDEHGNYCIVGRKKELIVRGGHNVHPREVEEVLHTHPAVREAAVIGAPDARLGEEVVAAVVLRDMSDIDESALISNIHDHAKQQLAAYKYPRRIKAFRSLPKSAGGKILKREIPPF